MRDKMPSHDLIVLSQISLLEDLGINPMDAHAMCWACRLEFQSSLPVRAHILADTHGGSTDPKNFFLLCNTCHTSQPDGAEREYQIQWLKNFSKVEAETNTDRLKEEFKKATGHELQELLNLMMDKWGTQGMLDRFSNALKKGSKGKAGVAHTNGIANAVYELSEIWKSLN